MQKGRKKDMGTREKMIIIMLLTTLIFFVVFFINKKRTILEKLLYFSGLILIIFEEGIIIDFCENYNIQKTIGLAKIWLIIFAAWFAVNIIIIMIIFELSRNNGE